MSHSPPAGPSTRLKVLGLGLPRTGTSSFARALEILFQEPVYHSNVSPSILANFLHPIETEQFARRWIDVLEISKARFENASSYTVSEAQRLKYLIAKQLEGYAAVTDAPGCMYARELREMYPEAKVIVTVRDEEQWLQSLQSLTKRLSHPLLGVALRIVPGMRHMRRRFRIMAWGRWRELYHTKGEIKSGTFVYQRHMEYLRRELGDDNIHFFNVKDGWEPLCEILGVEVPDVPFPHINDSAAFADVVHRSIRIGGLLWLGILGCVVGMSFWGWKTSILSVFLERMRYFLNFKLATMSY
ncbi:hypothetical protein ACLMJK_009268 [Lecanora helva]